MHSQLITTSYQPQNFKTTVS